MKICDFFIKTILLFITRVREAAYSIMEKNYAEEKSRPMILPVEWRASLVLDEGLTDFVTLPKMSSMRHALNSTVMDILYYQSPLYRNEVSIFSFMGEFFHGSFIYLI